MQPPTVPTGDPEHPSHPLAGKLTSLRGDLPRRGAGARGLTQLMLNPDCDRILVIRAARVRPGAVAQAAYGTRVDEGSRISFEVGVSYEKKLTSEGAHALVEAYQEAGILDAGVHRVLDLKREVRGSAEAAIYARLRLTQRVLHDRLAGVPETPSILLHPLCSLPALGGDVLIEPDVLVVPDDGEPLRLAEIKAIRDRGSRTNINDVARARAQAAAEVLAVRAALHSIGMVDPEARMPALGDLVLRKRLGMQMSRRTVDVSAEVVALERALAEAERRLPTALSSLPDDARLDDAAALEQIPNHYNGACHTHCPLASRCEATARASGDPSVLGEAVSDALGSVSTIPRLMAIVDGREQPANDVEARVVRDFLLVRSTLNTLDQGRANAV